ncbi:hypothetical protein RDWZM_009327 [Blomia tropicalis]|uniref:Uncharacterized protein n=1 Tax=Blomia tropicalis TaxID=40697 RepID=A0A9Q0RL78_BLOTA|nr:hypothetical protein RDWZM_009327 [Blomia tropicalis]
MALFSIVRFGFIVLIALNIILIATEISCQTISSSNLSTNSFTTLDSSRDESIPVNESTSTVLRHLQILFRHGDRAPLAPLFPYDPFNSIKYWPHGLDQLTNKGRARMFRLGQMIRAKYGTVYLGEGFSPREINVRSSAIDRCLESAQLVLAGAYPPNNTMWQWDINGSPLPLAQIWQPIPVTSFLPPNDDSLLRNKKYCPKAEAARNSLLSSPEMITLLEDNHDFLSELSNISGLLIDEIEEADRFYENLNIEHENGYYWSNSSVKSPFNWTIEHEIEALKRLKPFTYARWNNEFNSDIIKRVRAGELLVEIGNNFHQKKSVLDLENESQNKLMLYSSHDTKVAALLTTLGVWNRILVPYSSAIIFEMHQSTTNQADFFVVVRYFNETMSLLNDMTSLDFKDSYPLSLPKCSDHEILIDGVPMCPLDSFLTIISEFKFNDWNTECGIDSHYSSPTYLVVVNILLLIANLGILFILLLLVMYFWTKLRSREGYSSLE